MGWLIMLAYNCVFCRNEVKVSTEDNILFFDGYRACPKCYMKLQGADLFEIKKILLRIEKKINEKK